LEQTLTATFRIPAVQDFTGDLLIVQQVAQSI
jgi:hypothetical protein